MRFVQTDHQWAFELTAQLPTEWRRRILSRWQRMREGGADFYQEVERARKANIEMRETVSLLNTIRMPLSATDQDIVERANELMAQCIGLASLFHDAPLLRAAMSRKAQKNGIAPPAGKAMTDQGAIARMTDPQWWRRQLRRIHAKAVEGSAIRLGYVNKNRDLYCSAESVSRRVQQNKRNTSILEKTIAVNENDQEFTLAELVAVSTANKAIRRAELMTRISGFETIARDLAHVGTFMTITCPSRMHKWRQVGQAVIENPKYDQTNPRQAQAYLSQVWARIRASLNRQKIGLYGFRIAEPQHDGTPHWHFLIFHAPAALEKLKNTVLKYALQDSGTEPGAAKHRVDFREIDPTKGSAAGYIAKYVAKNIDGLNVGEDLYGNPAIETSLRVEAWAATWNIRQFQQIGGAPVTVWRELRRVKHIPIGAPDYLMDAWKSVNKMQVKAGRDQESVAWDKYLVAQGGPTCGKKYRIRMMKKDQAGVGRYGEPLNGKPAGVETVNRETYTPAHMVWMGGSATRLVHWFCESARHVWVIKKARSARPWTRVNNCTADQAEKPFTNITADDLDALFADFGRPPDKNFGTRDVFA